MSKEDFMRYANKRRTLREERKKAGEKEASNFCFETSGRINKRLSGERKRRNYRW